MDIFEQCPKCGKITQGIPAYEIKQQGVRTGTRFATKKILLYIATIIMGNVIFPVVGTFLGFIAAFFIAAYIEKKADQVSDSFVQTTFDSTPFDFRCPHCGNVWKRTYEKGVDFTTDFVLKWQKNCLVEDIRSEASSSRITAIISGIICAPCAFYCITHLSGQSEYFLWWLLFIIGLPALCISIKYGVKSHDKSQEADYLETMSITSFRNSNYRAGNPFVGVVKSIDKVNPPSPEVVSYPLQPKIIVPVTEEPTQSLISETSDSVKEEIAKLDDLLAAGVLTEKEHAEQLKIIAPTTLQPKTEAQVENNKISILKNLKLLLESGVLSNKEFKSQKSSTLSVVSIPWDKNKSKYEILEEMKSLLDAEILSQEEFDFHKKAVLLDNSSDSFSKSLQDNLTKLDDLLAADVVTSDEYIEEKKIISSYAYHSAKVENNKIAILNSLKMLLDSGIFTPEEYKKQKLSTLNVASIPWDKDKSKYEILEEMKSLLDADILSQEEFDFHKKALLSDNY